MTQEAKTVSRSFIIRAAGENDVPDTVTVFLETLGDLRKRHGIPNDPPEDRGHWEKGYAHVLRTGIFRVAEVDGRIAAICCGVRRDRVWFLTGFWVLPEFQNQKIGGSLIKQVWQEAADDGATIFFTWATIDTRAMGAYMKLGLLPGYPILTMGGGKLNIASAPLSDVKYTVETIGSPELPKMMDTQVLAMDKSVDHQFWLGQSDHVGRVVRINDKPIGYFYVCGHNGLIAPACWIDSKYANVVLEAALKESARLNPEAKARLFAPGINHSAIRFSLSAGLKILRFSHFLTSENFGRLDQYLPSGPMLF